MPDIPVTTHPTDRQIGLLATALKRRLTELSEHAAERILAPSGTVAYRRLVPIEELRGSCHAHLTFTLGSLTDRHIRSTTPATATALRRAGQGVPLPAVIAAYHAGGRMLLEELTAEARNAGHRGLEALPDGAARLLGLIESGAHEITTAYRHATRAGADQAGSPALAELFDGTARTTEALWRAADALRLPYDGLFVVLVADPPPGPVPELGNRLAAHGIASAWSHTAGLLAGLVSVRDQRTLERLMTVLARQATLQYGVSPAFASLADSATGLRLARLALAAADPAGPRVVRFDDGPLAGLVAHSPDVAARMARSVLGALLDLPAEQRTMLIGTLTAWYAASGSTEEAAQALYCHPNTVRQRLRRIHTLTGRTVTDPVGTAELYAALQSLRTLPPSALR